MFLYVKEFTVKRVSYKHSQLECWTYSIVCRGSVQKHPITSQLSLLETYFKCDVQVNQVYTLYSHNNKTIGMKCKANRQIRSSCIQTADKIMIFVPFHLFFSTHTSDTLSLPAAFSDSGKRLKFDGPSVWNQLQNQQTLSKQII